MSELLDRLRRLQPERQPNAALHELVTAIDLRNRDIQAAMLRGLDEQDELVHHYTRLMAALLKRQGGGAQLTEPTPAAEPPVHNVTLDNGWN